MKIHSSLFYLSLLLILCSTGCNRKTKLTAEQLDSLKTEYNIIIAAMDTSWKIMMDEDNRKLFYLKRLLQEVSYTNDYDSVKFDILMKRLEALKVLRYDQHSMVNSSRIDQYDSITVKLVPEIESLAKSHPKFENYPLMAELITEIDEMDNNVLFKRVDYDKTAKKFNEFVSSNGDVLKKNMPEADTIKKPLFQLSPN